MNLQTKCCIVCYSIGQRTSFVNVLDKCLSDLKRFKPNTPIILVGTKKDLRISASDKFVTTAEGEEMMETIKARAFIECSALEGENLSTIFETAVRCVMIPESDG